MKSRCSVNNCELSVIDELDECILHCAKSGEAWENTENIKDFCIAFKHYIADQTVDTLIYIKKEDILDYIEKIDFHIPDPGKKLIEDFRPEIRNIVFPAEKNQNELNYSHILTHTGSASLKNCTFYSSDIFNVDGNIKFSDCLFKANVHISRKYSEVHDIYRYVSCTFKCDVLIANTDGTTLETDNNLFDDCDFGGTLKISNYSTEGNVFRPTKIPEKILDKLVILSSHFKSKFIVGHVIGKMEIRDSQFYSKFECKHQKNCTLKIENTNFDRIADFYKSRFNNTDIYKCIFRDFVGFEDATFVSDKGISAVFKYTSFYSFTNFRNTNFVCGLNLRDANFEKSPNFLDASINRKNTNRETFRIVKNSFDEVGNKIEGNKYFAEEMRKYRAEVKVSGSSSDKLILAINAKVSDFGQSYWMPIRWILFFSAILAILKCSHQKNFLYKLCPNMPDFIGELINMVNEWAAGFIPLNYFLIDGIEALSILFYGIFATLIWQMIIAIKRHTRR